MQHVPARKLPSEDPNWLKDACAFALRGFDIPTGSAVAVFGSVAEGFGNDASDIDILVVAPGADRFGEARFMTGYEEHRVEVFIRGAESLRRFARELPESARGQVPEALCKNAFARELDTYHRIAHAYPVTDSELFAGVRAEFDTQWLVQVHQSIERHQALGAFARASLALQLEREFDSAAYARKTLQHAATHWACSRGETYEPRKFLVRRLQRAGITGTQLETYLELMRVRPGDPSALLARVRELATQFGVTLEGGTRWTLRAREGTAVVTVGRHTVVGRGERSAIVHDPQGVLSAALASGDVDAEVSPSALGFLHRAGMLEAVRDGDRWVDTSYHPTSDTLRITSEGIAHSGAPILVAHPIANMVNAALALLDGCFLLENLNEDALGAISRKDWATAHAALRSMARAQVTIALCHIGAYPLVNEHALVGMLRLHPALSELASVAEQLAGLTMNGPQNLPLYYDRLTQMRSMIPDHVISRHFRECHHSGVKWAKLVRYVYPTWTGAAMQLGFQLDPWLQEVLNYARTDDFPVNDEGMESMLSWHRQLNLGEEIERLRRSA